MSTFKLDLPYRRPEPKNEIEKENWVDNREFTLNLLKALSVSVFHDKLEGQKARIYGRIWRKIGEAVDGGKDTVELETAEKEALEKIINEGQPHPLNAEYYLTLCEYMDEWVKVEKKETAK